MISKRIGIAPKNDNYARLAAYIADAGYEGEKALMSWCAGCLGGEDYAEGIAEVLDTQAQNTRATNSKTYHLVVSFRPEDEAKLTPGSFKAIEERFAEALGWSAHQRHCGVHKNTGNIHMHIAYNMVHPEKYTLNKEFRDFWIRDKVCRELEREFGLVVDNGRDLASERQRERTRLGEKAALVEAHTGQQSFEGYAKSHREAVLQTLEAAASWQALHETLACCGLEIKPHGNGLAIKDRHSSNPTHAMKASALDRSLSQKKLEARLGPYLPPQSLEHIQEHPRYKATPLQRSPERGELFAEFKAGIEARKITLQNIKEQEATVLAAIRAEWAAKRRELEKKGIAKRNRRNLLQLARKHEAEALAKEKLTFQEPREVVRQEVPYTSWNGFLQHKAELGSEVALSVLRSSTEIVSPERPAAPVKDWSTHGQDYTVKTATRVEQVEKERGILEMEGISGKGKTRLQAVLCMEQVAVEQNIQIKHRVDGKGAVVFTLPNGGTVRDSGKEMFFTAQDKTAEAVAKGYAQKKWGKALLLVGNRIRREPGFEYTKEKQRGVER
ncbi:TraI/MobA(P) family conjugative relaxase [Desulfovibrio desulfuricans]|uniref:TraI/MobA(P) family conjugative relaxase n=1 Tax=Desulfovibrio desulfuricans TaxID=876 RepID=UPI0003B50FAA|nr:TraI/MobA(P) family conjugative relaxase [Desulfovibrio desulfuricans]